MTHLTPLFGHPFPRVPVVLDLYFFRSRFRRPTWMYPLRKVSVFPSHQKAAHGCLSDQELIDPGEHQRHPGLAALVLLRRWPALSRVIWCNPKPGSVCSSSTCVDFFLCVYWDPRPSCRKKVHPLIQRRATAPLQSEVAHLELTMLPHFRASLSASLEGKAHTPKLFVCGIRMFVLFKTKHRLACGSLMGRAALCSCPEDRSSYLFRNYQQEGEIEKPR